MFCGHKSTTCLYCFVSTKVQLAICPPELYDDVQNTSFVVYGRPRLELSSIPGKEKDDAPEKGVAAFFFHVLKDFFMKSIVPYCTQKDARALLYPVFRIRCKPFVYRGFGRFGLQPNCRWILQPNCR